MRSMYDMNTQVIRSHMPAKGVTQCVLDMKDECLATTPGAALDAGLEQQEPNGPTETA